MRVLLKRSDEELYVQWASWKKGKPWTIIIDWTAQRDQATRFWSKDTAFLQIIKAHCGHPLTYVLQYGVSK